MEHRKFDHLYRLTKREIEILRLLAKGLSNQQIAGQLCLTIRTVKFHTGNIYSKLGFKGRSQAIAWVWQQHGEIHSLSIE